MPKILRTLTLLTATLTAQIIEPTLTSSSSFTQAFTTARARRQGSDEGTRVVGRTSTGTVVYDQLFPFAPESAPVREALSDAAAALRASPGVTQVDNPKRISQATTTQTQASTERTGVTQTVGITRRDTIGPATTMVGTLATAINPCRGYSGGTPLGTGGLSPNDGFAFHFTTPVEPTGCPFGTRLGVPAGSRNIDTLTHIHSTITETITTVETTITRTTVEVVGSPGTPTTVPPEAPTEAEAREDLGIQVRYVANLRQGDAIVNVTNSGARGAGMAAGTSASTTGALCLNAYVFSPDGQFYSCCACPVTPNGLISLSSRQDFLSLTVEAPSLSLIVKLAASVPVGSTCSATNPGPPAPGLHAWATTVVGLQEGFLDVAEGPFRNASSPIGERQSLAAQCTAYRAQVAGSEICRSCRLGSVSTAPRP